MNRSFPRRPIYLCGKCKNSAYLAWWSAKKFEEEPKELLPKEPLCTCGVAFKHVTIEELLA